MAYEDADSFAVLKHIRDLLNGGAITASRAVPFATSVVPTVTNGAYSAGDIMGGLMTFEVAPANDQKVVLESINIAFKAAVVPSLTLVLFSVSPSGTTSTDNSAYSLAAADASGIIAALPLAVMGAVFVDHGTPNTYTLGNLELVMTPVSGTKNVLALLIDGTGVTLTSTSDVQVTLSGWGA
jgi:hypothetical protein